MQEEQEINSNQENHEEEEQEIPESKHPQTSQNNVSHHSSQQNAGSQSIVKATPLRTPGRLSRSIINRPHETRQRLMVDKIVLQDFKSYAGQKIIGPFHKSFTSVVGPNGSGKSNLIESLLFVFGKRANWMRLKQLHQLIHNSGQKDTPKKASVEVFFHEIIDKENDEYDIVPNSQFTVRRTVHMSNQTTYEINRKGSKQEEVIKLLKSKGIDLNNNRFLILQGEVEQISLMKPKSGDPDKPGLLEYLEDIIGSNQYKERIEDLEEHYEKDNEVRRERGERMRITEQDLEKLNESKNLAIDYIRREKMIYQIQNVLNQIYRYCANQKVVQTEKKIEEHTTGIKETKLKFKDKIQENKVLLQAWQKKKQELEETKSMRNKCKQEFSNLQEKDTKIRSEVKFETENQVKLENKKEECEKEYSKIVDDEKEMKKELPHKEKNLEKITEEKEEEEQKLTEIKHKLNQSNQKLVKEKKAVQNKLQPFENKIKNLKQQQNVIQDKINMLNNSDGDSEQQMAQCKENIEKAEREIQESEQITNQIGEAQKKMAEIKDQQYNELKNIEGELEGKCRQSTELQRQIDLNRSNQNENQQRNQLVSELIRAQQNGEVFGIHGRLGDLGAIDKEYDIAITTACGALDNIVVSNQESGQQCIKMLREKRLGRAQFMPVKTLNDEWYAKSRQQFNAPPGSKRLFDLIKIKKEEYAALFYFALRDTLVCQDIDQGTKIAYGPQRYRVVTLDGKLIDTSGTMSGGGRPKKGGMGTQLQADNNDVNIQELQNQRVVLEREIQHLKQQQDNIKSRIHETARDETHAKSVMNERQGEVQFKKQQIEDYIRKLQYYEGQQERNKDKDKEVRALEQQLKKLSDEENKKEQECMELKAELEKIEEQFSQLGGNEMKEQQQLVNQLKKNYEKLEHDVNQIRNKINNTEKTLKKNEKETKDVTAKLQKIEKKIESSKQQLTQLEEDAMQVLGKLKGLEEKVQEMESDQQQQDELKVKLDDMIRSMKEELEKMTSELDNCRSQHKKYSQDYNSYDKKLETLRQEYSSIVESYDFINDLDEIANFSTDPEHDQEQQQQENQNNDDMELENENSNPLEETVVQDQQSSNQKTKKRMSIGIDQKQFLQKDVTEDFNSEELEQASKYAENFNFKLRNEESKLQNLKSEININTILEFKGKYIEYKSKKGEFEEVKKKLAETRTEIDKLKKQRFEEFIQGFNTISQKLKETYQNLTQGGDAELELIDSLDPFADGINFTVRPPKKSWKQISKLSGGEKTLSSLSLIFALHYYKPTPLYFMDEIDAALDFKNVSVVGHYVKERTQDAQFIIISLRNNMFELANKLVGVYKTFDQTKTIAIVPEKVQKNLEKAREDKENNNPNDVE